MPVSERRAPRGRLARAGLIGLLSACAESNRQIIDPPFSPSVDHSSVAPGESNVLSARVTVQVSAADSVAIRFGPAGGSLDSVTPAVPASATSAPLPVLGLLPGTSYQFQAIAYGGELVAHGELLALTTSDLPVDLPAFAASGSSPSPGFVLFAAGNYGIVIDNTGRVVWYLRLAGTTLNIQAQPTGRYTTAPVVVDTTDPTPWIEYDPLGNITRELGCVAGRRSRFHDLLMEPDGTYWIMCDDTRVLDLSGIGGNAAAQVTGTEVQRLTSDGYVIFSWSPFDHLALTDLDSISRSGPTVNWTHGNALDRDLDGNLLVSFRSLSEIIKIDTGTGAVIWRMGGLANQFSFAGGIQPFRSQHGLRAIAPGQLQVLDNLGELGGSRAERYQFDEAGRTASLVTSYSAAPPVTAQLGGTTQLLPQGRILVAYGNGSRVQEYDASGNVVWEIQGSPGYIFRAQRISSLYHPGVGTAR